jgi:hypothetical protein
MRTNFRFSAIEWVVVVAIAVALAVRIWASELRAFEQRLLTSLGMPGSVWYVLVGITAAISVFHEYKRAKDQSRRTGQPIVRPTFLVVTFTVASAVVAAIYVINRS